ncbi:MAG: hypothetical protein N4A36_02585 [Candidatus Gracilibacteria bacterium]|jgi:hypothetical protein|nr:hypothetical protein [Candidatus Gracilibacteria bacterium]
MKKRNLLILALLIIGVVFVIKEPAFAANEVEKLLNKNRPDFIPSISKSVKTEDQVNYLAFKVIDIILILSGIVAVFFITLAGVKLVTSGGVEDRIDSAKKTITYATIGLFGVILSWAIVTNVVKLLFTEFYSPDSKCLAVGQVCTSDNDCCSGDCSGSESGIYEVCVSAN